MKNKIKGKYGYIEFIDKKKLNYDGWDENIEPEIRKPTPAEREEIILNYIRYHSGEVIKVDFLADKLAVSDRTIQSVLKKLKEQKLITSTPYLTETNRQLGNIITYIGPKRARTAQDLTLKKLYAPDNPCGFRDWHWEEFKFIPGYYDEDFTKKDAYYNYKFLRIKKNEISEKKNKFYDTKKK